MSKIIKSERCVETHPCRLEPIDVDAFFINNEEEAAAEAAVENSAEMETGLETPTDITDINEENSETKEAESEALSSEVTEAEQESETASQLWSSAVDGKTVRNDAANLTELTFDAKNTAAPTAETVNLDRLANVAETIESLITGAQQQAGSIAENARGEADNILQGANQKAGAALEQAKQKADEITFGAENKASSMMTQAKEQSETILAMAKDQSALIVEGAKQQTEKMLEKARKQAQVIVENAKKEAAVTVETAQKQAEELIQTANQESITIKEQAHQEGIEAGRAEAITVVRQELADNLNKALSLIQEVESERMERLASSEPELLKLAVSIAEKIIGAELKLEPTRQLEIVREALSKITTSHTVTLRIHPEDTELVNQNLIMLQEAFNEPKPIQIQTDPSIAKGSCFIETDHGNLDVRVKSQLDRIMADLLKVGQIP